MKKILAYAFRFAMILQIAQGNLTAQETKEEFKPYGKIGGYAFGDVYLKSGGDTATWASRAEFSGVPKDVYAFTLRRMYLSYDYVISPRFSTSAILEANDGLQSTKGDRSVTIKALNVKWINIYPRADLIFGQMSTLTFSFVSEKVWSYRSVEKTIADQRGIRTSSDMGVAIYGKLDTLGNFGYNVMMGNGTGTRPEDQTYTGKHKVYYGELYGKFFERKLIVDLYGDLQTGPDGRNVITSKLFLGYQSKRLTIGGEVLSQRFSKIKSDGTDAMILGYSLFARAWIIKDKMEAFIRYDSFDPDNLYRDQDAIQTYNAANMFRHYEEEFFLLGLDITLHKNVHIMPNIWINSYKPKAETELLVERKSDIVPRLTYLFIFK